MTHINSGIQLFFFTLDTKLKIENIILTYQLHSFFVFQLFTFKPVN